MTKPLSIAVTGCGFFAQNHLHAWQGLSQEGAKLVAVCDVDFNKAQAAAQAFDLRAYTDFETMMDVEKPQLVDVVTRAETHFDIAKRALARGIATIVQKPLAPDWQTCCAIADAAAKSNTFLAVHENFRFQQPMMRLKALIDEGVVGPPTWARFSFRTGHNVYADQPYFYDENRLAILDVGVHLLDVARVMMGEVETVNCQTQRRNPRVKGEDTATMMLRHFSGAVSVVDCTYEARRLPEIFPHTSVEIEGPLGSLILRNDDKIIVTSNDKRRVVDVANVAARWMTAPFHVVQQSVCETNRSFLNAVRNKKCAPTNITDNLKTFALVEAAYASASNGRAETPLQWAAAGEMQ